MAERGEARMDFDEAQDLAEQHAPQSYYAESYRIMERMYLPALFNHLETYPATRVLEIGPGFGTTAAWLAAHGHDVTVMDRKPVGTFMTQELIDTIGVAYVHNDVEDQASPDGQDLGSFDLIIMTQVIPHLAWRPDRALRHVRSLLAHKGTFVTSVIDQKDYGDLESAFGDDWRNIPEWRTADESTDIVKCMYTKKAFSSLLNAEFSKLTIWKPKGGRTLFARVKA